MNNELVKYGKEKISEAITEKGVPTASTEMFDQMATNIRSINSYSGSSALNIYCQTNKPTAQNGLWIKRPSSEINDIQIKNGIYTADGTANNIKSNTEHCRSGGWSGLVGSVLYCLSGYSTIGTSANDGPGPAIIDSSSGKNFSISYDIDTDIFTNIPFMPEKPSYSVENMTKCTIHQSNLVYNNSIYILGCIGGTNNANMVIYIWRYDTKTSVTTRYNVVYPMTTNIRYVYGAKIIGNKMYITVVGNSGTNYNGLCEYDLDTNIITLITSGLKVENMPIIVNGDILEICAYISSSYGTYYKIDPVSKTRTTYSEAKPIYHYKNTSKNYYGIGGQSIQIGDLLYTFGGMGVEASDSNDTLACKSVSIYNIKTRETTGLDNILPQAYGSQYTYYYAYYKGNVYLIGGFYHGSGSNYTDRKWYHTIAKFAINSKDLEPGTIVCDPSSYFNSTEMYNDGKTKLDFGVNQVYYQSANGFSIQPAAVIKNGVDTNIN